MGNVYTKANATTHTFALSLNGVSALDSTLFHDDIVDGSIGVVSRVGRSNEIVYVDSIANDRTIRTRDGHGFTAGDEIVLLGLHGVAGTGGARAHVVEATTETTIAFQGNDALFQNAVVQSGVAVRVKTKLFSINTNDQNNGVVVSKSMVVDGGKYLYQPRLQVESVHSSSSNSC